MIDRISKFLDVSTKTLHCEIERNRVRFAQTLEWDLAKERKAESSDKNDKWEEARRESFSRRNLGSRVVRWVCLPGKTTP